MKSPKEQIGLLASEIAQLEARYDGLYPPEVYAVLENLRREFAKMQKAP